MKIINILADGTQVEDMSTITVPIENGLYEVCRGILERQNSDIQSELPLKFQTTTPSQRSAYY